MNYHKIVRITALAFCCAIFTCAKADVVDTLRVVNIDEVVVASRPKDNVSLRQQPLASTSLDANDLEHRNAHELSDVAAMVPSLAIPHYGSRLTSSIYVRGIGSRINSPAVGLTINDIPLVGKAAFNTHLYGLSSAEVLRGPQGTLYGQNTEGGLLRLYYREPQLSLVGNHDTRLSLGVGTKGTRLAEVESLHTFTDWFGLSVAAFYNGQDGFFKNAYSGEKADKMSEGGARAALFFKLTRDWRAELSADYQYVDQNGFAYGELSDGHTQAPNTNFQSGYLRNLLTSGLHLSHQARRYQFHSITSWQYLKDQLKMDIDYLPADLMMMRQRQLQNAVTQEFTFSNAKRPALRQNWQWTTGAFASYQWLKTQAPVFFGDDFNTQMSTTITSAMAQAGVDAQVATSLSVPGLFHTPQFNLGFFHQSTFQLWPRLALSLGLRYDYTHVRVAYETSAVMPVSVSMNMRGRQIEATRTLQSVLNGRAHDDFNQLLPKIALTWQTGTDPFSNAYLQVSKGYRAGGFNIQMFSDILQTELMNNYQSVMRGDYSVPHTADDYANIEGTIAFKPETSWNFEGGLHQNFLEGRLKIDFAAYWVQIRNQQLSVMAGNYGFGRAMKNAGKSRSKGVEITAKALLFDGALALTGTYGYTRAKFQDYVDSVKTNGTWQQVDYKDKYVPFVPQHTFSLAADYELTTPLHFLPRIMVGADVSGRGTTYWDEANTTSQNLYAVLGAHADLHFSPTLMLSLWGKNLTNTHYNTFAIQSSADRTTRTFAQLGHPLQLGITLKLHLN